MKSLYSERSVAPATGPGSLFAEGGHLRLAVEPFSSLILPQAGSEYTLRIFVVRGTGRGAPGGRRRALRGPRGSAGEFIRPEQGQNASLGLFHEAPVFRLDHDPDHAFCSASPQDEAPALSQALIYDRPLRL